MSRISSTAATTSLTDELDKLEQSITLTLQEIDHNFSRAHGIVTSSILPIIEKYAEHSNALWEGSKFWKQFFEASANVSLSGVEENDINEDLTFSHPPDHTEQIAGVSSKSNDGLVQTDKEEDSKTHDLANDSVLEDEDISESTPRVIESTHQNKEISTKRGHENTPKTPGYRSLIQTNTSCVSKSSIFNPKNDSLLISQVRPSIDPLLHRVLDKTYRLQATPLKAHTQNVKPSNKPFYCDIKSPMSSPPEAVPQLHTDLFCSPTRPQFGTRKKLTPVASIFTPAKVTMENITSNLTMREEIGWESDSNEDPEDVYKELGMSPPKTIQFNLPQSRLLRTPAREASQRIVQDLLATAGVGFDTSDVEDSPSLAAKNEANDSF